MSRLLVIWIIFVLSISPLWPVGAFGQAEEADEGEAEAEITYIPIADPTLMERRAADLEDTNVQLPDYFRETIEARDFPREVRREGVSPREYYGFYTGNIRGSNMIVFAPRNDEDVQAFFETPALEGTQIYLMGTVGPRIFTDKGRVTLFLADKVYRGHTPPAKQGPEQPKAVIMKMEWVTTGPDGRRQVQQQEYKIPKAGVGVAIPDPYDPSKKLYMTFEF